VKIESRVSIMSFGKMNTAISLITVSPVKDSEAFTTQAEQILASVYAYKEDKNSTEKWANMAAFSEATALFRFRRIPEISVTSKLCISCGSDRYQIFSVEDVRGRGMYIEVLAKKLEGSVM